MSQNDFNIANQGFAAFRGDLNGSLQALATNSSGATGPSITYAYQWWYDTTANILKIRNAANSDWINFASFDQGAGTWSISGDLTIADKIVHSGDTNTAIRFPAADTVTVETSGAERLRVDSSGNVGIGTASPTTALDVTGIITTSVGVNNTSGALYSLRNVVYLTSGTAATYTPPTGTRALRVTAVGAGGGGGGVDGQGSGTGGAAGGGGAGGAVHEFITAVASSYTYTIGAGGAGGTAGSNDGTAGGTTTFSGTGVSLSAGGGAGGAGRPASSSAGARGARGDGGSASGGDLNVVGSGGTDGYTDITINSVGNGGPSVYGTFGAGFGVNGSSAAGGAGVAAAGYGAGGGGASVVAQTSNYAGGAGAGGLIIVEELA